MSAALQIFRRAVQDHQAGRLAHAEAGYRRAARLDPRLADAFNNLATLLLGRGDALQAEALCRRALAINPAFAGAHYNLALAMMALRRPLEAEVAYRQSIELAPGFVEAFGNLGALLNELGRVAEAEEVFLAGLKVKPTAAILNNLGNLYSAQHRLGEARSCYVGALQLAPALAEAERSLANVLKHGGLLVEGEAHARRAVELRPSFADAYLTLGSILVIQGRAEEGIAACRQAVKLAPANLAAHSTLIFDQHYLPAISTQDALAAATRFGEAAEAKATPYTTWNVDPAPERLRVGLVSGDLRDHPVGHFLEAVLGHIDPARLELIAYPTSPLASGLTERIKTKFAAWKPLHGLDDESAARLIHADGVHCLMDLAGHSGHNRLPLFAWKPAPLQVAWLGYFGTTGLRTIDYVLGDPIVAPPQESAHFVERLWRMPDCYLCFTPPDTATEIGPLPMIARGHVTFGCFNNVAKLNDAVLHTWSEILLAIPDAQLFLKALQFWEPAIQDCVRARFAKHGVAATRLRIEGPSSRAEYLQCYNDIDIALDPFPYPGGTTSAEALWMGVPVLTKRGDRFLGHAGESIAINAGLPEWIADTDASYVAKAITFSRDVARLKALRAGLRDQVRRSPLFDAPRFARNFEDALTGMWRN